MNASDSVVKAELLEAMEARREIEFLLGEIEYRLEPDFDNGGYIVWRYLNGFRDGAGVIVARVATSEEAFEVRCFDGKTLLEALKDAVNKYII